MIALLLSLAFATSPATDSSAVMNAQVRNLRLTVQTRNLKGLRQSLDSALLRAGAKRVNSSGSGRGAAYGNSQEMVFVLPDSSLEGIQALLAREGEITHESSSLHSIGEELDSLERERNWLIARSKTWKEEVARRQEGKSTSAEAMWDSQQRLEQEIYQLDKSIASVRKRARGSRLSLTMEQSSENPMSSGMGFFQFVNMPGVEYAALWVQNPARGRTAERYQGFMARYLFTRAKSWIELGALSSQGGTKTDSLYTDIFLYGWGTDFYPRHFGRGVRRWFNFYSGFSVGGAFLSSSAGNDHIPYLSPHAGVELFKSDRVMIDVRGGYFVPLSSQMHMKLRGFSATGGLQFSF